MSVIVTVLDGKVYTTFSLFVPFFPWEYYPCGHFVLVDLVTMVIYFYITWLVVDQGRELYTFFMLTKVVEYVLDVAPESLMSSMISIFFWNANAFSKTLRFGLAV